MALLTYSVTANREDLIDIITNISPTDTPIYSLVGKAKGTGHYHEWPQKELRNPKANALIQGADYTVDNAHAVTPTGNYMQIVHQSYGISESQQAVLTAGVKNYMAESMVDAMKECALDVEYMYINNAALVQGDATTASQAGGIPGLVTTNVLDNGGVARALAESLFNDGIQQAWASGGKPDTIVASGKQKRVISAFTAGATKNVEASSKKLIASVDVYDSDFGLVRVVSDRWMPDTSIFVLQKSLWRTAYLRQFKKKDLHPDGDRIEKVVVGELTIECRAEKGNCIVTDLS